MTRYLCPRLGRDYGYEIMHIAQTTNEPDMASSMIALINQLYEEMQGLIDDGMVVKSPQIHTYIGVYSNAILEIPV
jgi:hypothetical protein